MVMSIMSACGLEISGRALHRGQEGIFTSFLKSGNYLSHTGDGICEINKVAVVLRASPEHRKEYIQTDRMNTECHWSFLTASGRVWVVIPNILSSTT